MGFHIDDAVCRVGFFKQSGKWYTTEAVRMLNYNAHPVDNLKESLLEHFKDTPGRLSEMTAVCIEPYSRHGFPVMVRDWNN